MNEMHCGNIYKHGPHEFNMKDEADDDRCEDEWVLCPGDIGPKARGITVRDLFRKKILREQAEEDHIVRSVN